MASFKGLTVCSVCLCACASVHSYPRRRLSDKHSTLPGVLVRRTEHRDVGQALQLHHANDECRRLAGDRRAPTHGLLQGKKQMMVNADDLCRGSMQFENHRRTALQYPPPFIEPYAAANNTALLASMKALARYQIILLGEQRMALYIRCEQLAQGCCPNNAAVEVEPATSWSRVQRPTTTLPSHQHSNTAQSNPGAHPSPIMG